MKKLGFVAIILSLLVTFAYAGGTDDSHTDSYTIATVVKIDGIAWFDRMRVGVEEYGEENGYDTFLLGPSQADAAEQVRIIEDLIAEGVDAICVVPFSVEAVEPVLARAREEGIVVVSHEASTQENADAIIEAFDNAAYGEFLMENLAQRMGGTGTYATFVGSLQSKSHNEWVDAAVAYQEANYPDMELVQNKIEEFDDFQIAYEKTLELLTAYPELDGIQGSAMTTAPGAGLAVEERGLQDKVSVVGTSLVSVSEQYLESGATDMIAFWDPAMAGRAMNEIAVRILNGESIDNGANLGVTGYKSIIQDAAKPNLYYGSAWVGVTKDNMNQYNF
ncbi:Ribose ABC transport system, periplasmic ribose-binding protein RbsB (TC 3.A.1.2.1) [Olavius algarvensis spirochete endosymbiont]|uniref:autoinducer 2 ABC transporter substrate-binding protein n=1 Tax=Olavius algarvensis spirochete endosymbiont TaxID=260710 RepID=UPI000F2029BC|nr:autoinducer 2 ABC transporter substrate-binding protein [Olavius algarvensis spirochete endosymbiont]CAD7843309.1 MAG: ABC transporter, substrate-binding protein (cluster 2, ribose/xylose/arabinose/galactose) [Olavius algarvensis spirochete endosymbiont]VDA99428.1 Ribose ABC transport system, periplasmic ribose-binding protein RbsB (TC 3.A.1.2.1) [Olavius algarvensis spirochete endosymbiont]